MKTLVVTDVQYDFFHPDGALYVKGGEFLPTAIEAVAGSYDSLVFTLDWHPSNHCSFKEQGGIWPAHCVNYSQGAGLAPEFSKYLDRPDTYLFFKGNDPLKEQYGAFENLAMDDPIRRVLETSDEVDICGIAGDYCVKETTVNLLKMLSSQRIVMLRELICSIDDGSTLKSFIRNSDFKVRMSWDACL